MTSRSSIYGAFLALLVFVLLLGGCGGDGDTGPQPDPRINFTNRRAECDKPQIIRFYFSLRDEEGHAVIIDEDDMQSAFRISEYDFEKYAWEEVCYEETAYNPTPAANLSMAVAIVLDFTNSMKQFNEGGLNGIDQMIEGVELILDALGPAHQVSIIEYHHEQPLEPTILTGPTTDKQVAAQAIRDFAEDLQENGGTRSWDAMCLGVSELLPLNVDVKLLIALSDGFDTSSELCTDNDLIDAASAGRVQIFALGYGTYDEHLDNLKRVALATGGVYYSAPSVSDLRSQLETVARDLGGQYNLSYVTLNPEDAITTRVGVTYGGRSGEYDTLVVIQDSCGGDVRVGEIQVDRPVVGPGNTATMFARITYTPRHIRSIRFKLGTDAEQTDITFPTRTDGGICEDWGLSGPDVDGFYTAEGDTLRFGIEGLFAKIDLTGVECGMHIPFDVDNSIYPEGKYFVHPEEIVLDCP